VTSQGPSGIHVEGGALCAACHSPRPFAELLAFAPITSDGRTDTARIRYVCRPSVSDMRRDLCTSRALKSARSHAIALATDVERLRRSAAHAPAPRAPVPAHIRDYVSTTAA
jgi:hypothetical protein